MSLRKVPLSLSFQLNFVALWDEWDREKKYMTQIKILKDKIEKNHKKGRINRSRSNKTKKTPKRGSTEKENYLKGEKLLSGRSIYILYIYNI